MQRLISAVHQLLCSKLDHKDIIILFCAMPLAVFSRAPIACHAISDNTTAAYQVCLYDSGCSTVGYSFSVVDQAGSTTIGAMFVYQSSHKP